MNRNFKITIKNDVKFFIISAVVHVVIATFLLSLFSLAVDESKYTMWQLIGSYISLFLLIVSITIFCQYVYQTQEYGDYAFERKIIVYQSDLIHHLFVAGIISRPYITQKVLGGIPNLFLPYAPYDDEVRVAKYYKFVVEPALERLLKERLSQHSHKIGKNTTIVLLNK